MKNLRYYLDTNAVQSLGTKLESLPNECVYTSVWTQLELVSAIKDDDCFRKKTAALRHLSDSGIFIDQIIPGAKKVQAFGCIAPEGGKIPHLSEVIMPMIFVAGNYEEFWKPIKCHGMEKCMKLIKETNDLMHLQYLRNGCKLVTDDTGFQKYVNKMVDGLAIGTERFLNDITNSQTNS